MRYAKSHLATGTFVCLAISLALARTDIPFPRAVATEGIAPAALKKLDTLVAGFVDAGEIIGAELLVIKNRKTVLHTTHGWMDRKSKRAYEKHTRCNIRSMTKVMTGMAIQMLIDEKKLKLDDPVATVLKSFDTERVRTITIDHLMTHRSGFPMKSPGTLWTNYASYGSVLELANYWARHYPRASRPGARYHYADANSDILAAVVQTISGMPFEQFLEERIIKPLGMRNTVTRYKRNDPRFGKVATLYWKRNQGWPVLWKPGRAPYFSFSMGAQSVYSTPMDYARFLAAWMDEGQVGGRPLISNNAVKRAIKPVSFATLPTGFVGLRSRYGRQMHLYTQETKGNDSSVIAFGHSGTDGTYAWAFPKEDLMVLYFTQSRGNITMMRMETAVDTLVARPPR